jgi:hypothetical protein
MASIGSKSANGELSWWKLDRVTNKPITPFLFAIFPILILLGNNIDQVVFSIALRAFLISILGTGIIFLLFRLILHRWSLAAVNTSIGLFLFFTYGHAYEWINSLGKPGILIGRHRFMLPLWLGLFVAGWLYSRRKQDELGTIVKTLNIFGVVAVLLPMFQIISYLYNSAALLSSDSEIRSLEGDLSLSPDQDPPDIYYFILDSYTRRDVLLEYFDYDNAAFLEGLEALGFYVARCSQSNYTQTDLAMASTFNLDYLQSLLGDSTAGEKWLRIPGFIRSNTVRRSLEELGYTIVSFETGFYAIQWMDADVYLFPPRDKSLGELFNVARINDFEALLLKTTAAWALIDLVDLPDQLTKFLPDLNSPISIYRQRTLYVLDQFAIDRVPSISGPKFVYVHLILPHPPYVFGPNGEVIHEEKEDLDLEAYRDQLIYTNRRILDIITRIVRSAPKPNIIILQGDHGLLVSPAERVAILNAYYLPEGDSAWLYPSISPVNTFRGIFNQYFQADYELLEDISYFSLYENPPDLKIVPQMSDEACLIEIDS